MKNIFVTTAAVPLFLILIPVIGGFIPLTMLIVFEIACIVWATRIVINRASMGGLYGVLYWFWRLCVATLMWWSVFGITVFFVSTPTTGLVAGAIFAHAITMAVFYPRKPRSNFDCSVPLDSYDFP